MPAFSFVLSSTALSYGFGGVFNRRRRISSPFSWSLPLDESDMPQPLIKIDPDCGVLYSMAGQSPLSRIPELGALVSEVIASWTHVEVNLMRLFMALIGGRNTLASELFLSMESRGARAAAIAALARTKLKDKQRRDAVEALLHIAKSKQGERDRVAHWVWGTAVSTKTPNPFADAVVLIDPRIFVRSKRRPHEGAYVYRKADLERIVEDNNRVAILISSLWRLLQHPNAKERRAQLLQLCAEPEVREALSRREKKAKRNASE